MTPRAERALNAIRAWVESAGRGPTSRELQSYVGRDVAKHGLAWLKTHRLVTWASEGSGTRYVERTKKSEAA